MIDTADTIKTVRLSDNSVIRSWWLEGRVDSIDVNQIDGSIVTSESNVDGQYLGRVTIYPQNISPLFSDTVYITSVSRGGDLNYTLDSRFDYIRRKIWIADSGNHRVIKLNGDNYSTDVISDDLFYYPHSVAVNFNNGGVFVKAYNDLSMSGVSVYYLGSRGEEKVKFSVNNILGNSSSSSSSSSVGNSDSSSSSSMEENSSSSSGSISLPDMPHSRSMVFDYVRSRLWWVSGSKINLLDVRGKQVQVYDLRIDGYFSTRTVDVDLNTGNPFIVASDIHDKWFLVQMNRDNNKYLGFVTI